MFDLYKPGSRFEKFFPYWIPNCIASNICKVPHCDLGECVTFVSNSTCVHEVFDRIVDNWDKMRRSRSYLHVFEQDGISTQDMTESRNVLQYISDEYCGYATRPDFFVKDGSGALIVNEDAGSGQAEIDILNEMKELGDGELFITADTDRRMRR